MMNIKNTLLKFSIVNDNFLITILCNNDSFNCFNSIV